MLSSPFNSGPNDNFDLEKSHVLPGLLRKIHLGKCLEDGNWVAIREDLARRPIEGMNERRGEEENGQIGEVQNKIISILDKYGIKIAPSPHRQVSASNNQYVEFSTQSVKSVSVEIWGSGNPMREFLWSEEMADACVYLMENIDFEGLTSPHRPNSSSPLRDNSSSIREIRNSHINIGTGNEISIHDLACLIKKIVGFKGGLVFNTSKPDGTMRKLTDVSRLNQLGWQHKIEIEEGVARLYRWYLDN